MKWSFNQKLLQDEECKCEIESRNLRKLRRQRCFFLLKALGILCLVVILGGSGLFFAVGSFECLEQDVSNIPNNASSSVFVPQCSSILEDKRVDCWPESGDVDEQKCTQRGCCWKSADESSPGLRGVPWCFYPSNYQGYTVQSLQKTTYGMTIQLLTTQPSWWPNEIQHITLDVQYDSAERLHFKFYDPNFARYEVPVQLNKTVHHTSTPDYIVDVPSSGAFYIKVTRRSTGKILFNTQDAAPLVFTDQFIQLGTQLSTKFIYGLGEHRSAFLQSTDWTKMAFWSRDQPPSTDANLYGVHPFYLNIEDDNKTHGVLLLNSNAMEAELQPAPALTYRTTGGVLDFYIFTGPTPDQVVQQYTSLIGRPFMPPYWALGFHLCRWGYKRGSSGMKDVINRMRAAQMPYCLFHVEKGIMDGLDLAVFACKEQFQNDLWNCPVTANSIVSKATSSQVTKEIAFLQAITAAGIMYATSKSSTREDNPLCGCGKIKDVDRNTEGTNNWVWGGCSHNVECGKKVSTLFLGSDAKSGNIDQVLKSHNERSGYRAVKNALKVQCRCHGLTFSCTMKTCWKTLSEFHVIAEFLREKYKRSRDVRRIEGFMQNNTKVLHSRVKGSSKHDLVYSYDSPNYCKADHSIGYLGTHGRECLQLEKGADKKKMKKSVQNSCNRLCKGCGHEIGSYIHEETYECCTFIWCCELNCKLCSRNVTKYYCK